MKWTNDQLKELKDNYRVIVNNKKEAEIIFQKSWRLIIKEASKLGLIYNIVELSWTDEQVKELRKKYFYYLDHKDEAEFYFKTNWRNINEKARELKITSMKINKKCSMFLGVHVAERVLSHVFKVTERMPHGNKGFDFICNKGKKIDSKSSCLLKKRNHYNFSINKNKLSDYFLCIAFDNREDLNPQHIWLINSNEVIREKKLNEFKSLVITNTNYGISKFSKYELTDKLKETIECCNVLKNVDDSNKLDVKVET